MLATNPFIIMLMLALVVAIGLMCCSTLFGCAPGCDPAERARRARRKGLPEATGKAAESDSDLRV
ncbi:hypothetical protein BW247_08885 [Acidihalobacter ferrooxydans]|uniref:Uncharacterized protein n=1 Tax=Acidihalobacter ferrooxydans TaxID=1765967 RepID=A0A1P8UHF4_9GAMM|nr:hypothetical protein BW247_08885 [Acidihalobacter ferrooxydans]